MNQSNKHLRYLSLGIPLACACVLVWLGMLAISPMNNSVDLVYAEEGENGNEGSDLSDENYEIDLLANAPNAEATLTIGGEAINATTNVGLGSVGYRKHTVKIKTTDVTNYTLSITGPTNLNGNTTVTGANNKTSANMSNNTWGYYYGDSSNEASVAYQSFTGSAQNLETNSTGVNNPGTTAKNLIFAAKFADTATAGHYTASVVLSLVATPKQINTYTLSYNTNGGSTAPTSTSCTTAAGVASCNVTVTSTTPTKANNEFLGWSTSSTATTADANYAAGKTVSISADTPLYAVWKTLGWDGTTKNSWNDLTYMQEMTSAACTSAPSKTEKILTDSRDNNTYTVAKLDDSKCWMTQNLAIVGKTITKDDSDITAANWPVPASSASGFSSDTASNVYYADSTTNGAYYTWCAATANTCTSATTDGAIAPSSICPKGWRLPTKTEYDTLLSSASIGNNSTGNTKIRGTPYNFPYVKGMNGSGIKPMGSGSGYWSSTAGSSGYAYNLDLNSSNVYTGYDFRFFGFSVRCIAK